jgi:hypothetical protein
LILKVLTKTKSSSNFHLEIKYVKRQEIPIGHTFCNSLMPCWLFLLGGDEASPVDPATSYAAMLERVGLGGGGEDWGADS